MKPHGVVVKLVDGKHVCDPTETTVEPQDTVTWGSSGSVITVSFPNGSPFKEGPGPFKAGESPTVKSKPPLKTGDVFVPEISLNGKVLPTVGNIKVT